MIRIERDPAFWVGIASHPALAGALMGLAPEAIGPLVLLDAVQPFAADHGGFLFSRLDALGFVHELHSLFTPEGWGREVSVAGKQALAIMFDGPCRILTTLQVQSNARSHPPKSYGFVPVGDWTESAVGVVRPWLLTKEAWLGSPAHRRTIQ